jgi:hypothetical protein
MIKNIQAAIGAKPDGAIGTQTMSDIACRLGAIREPLTLSIYGAPVIIARDILPISTPRTGVSAYANAISGSFTMPQAVGPRVPISILISSGKVIRELACHADAGYPEAVLYREINGAFGIALAKDVSELPPGLSWAVGGVGLLAFYDPPGQGFKRIGSMDFSDVLRSTGHTMIGVKNGHVFLIYCAAMTGQGVNNLAKLLGLEMAIMLDGGHLAAINGGGSFAKINTGQVQGYIIQAI